MGKEQRSQATLEVGKTSSFNHSKVVSAPVEFSGYTLGFAGSCVLLRDLLELVTGVGLENREEGLVNIIFTCHTRDGPSRPPNVLLRTGVRRPNMFPFSYA